MHGNLFQISALVGFFLPHAIAVIKQEHWRKSIRQTVAVGACAVAAAVTAYVQGKLNVANFGESATTIFLMAQTSYMSIWKGSAPIAKIAAATEITPTTP